MVQQISFTARTDDGTSEEWTSEDCFYVDTREKSVMSFD